MSKRNVNSLFKRNETNYSFNDYFVRYSLVICSIILGITLFTSVFQVDIYLFPFFYFGKLTIISFIIGIAAVWVHLKIYTRKKDVNHLFWLRRKEKKTNSPKGNIIGMGILLALLISFIYMYTRYGTLFIAIEKVDGNYQPYSWLNSNAENVVYVFVIALILVGILDLIAQISLNRYGVLVIMSVLQIILIYFIYNSAFTQNLVLDFNGYTLDDYVYFGLFILFIITVIQVILSLIIRLINFSLFIHDKILGEI